MHGTKVVMPYTLAYLQENDFQNGMNVTWQLLISKIFHVKSPLKKAVSLMFDWWFPQKSGRTNKGKPLFFVDVKTKMTFIPSIYLEDHPS